MATFTCTKHGYSLERAGNLWECPQPGCGVYITEPQRLRLLERKGGRDKIEVD